MSRIVSTKDESPRLFKSDFMEFFTRVYWCVPLVLYVPLISYVLYKGILLPESRWESLVGYFLLGFASWTLFEYLMHRYFFHFHPKSPRLKRIFYLIHEIHHEYPNDSRRLVMPPIESIPLAIIIYYSMSALFSGVVFYPFYAGFGLGYLCYDMIHYAVHHLPMENPIAKKLKQQHMKHHFTKEDRYYGVSSPFWDWVFRTDH